MCSLHSKYVQCERLHRGTSVPVWGAPLQNYQIQGEQHHSQLLSRLLHGRTCPINRRVRGAAVPPLRLQQVLLPVPRRQQLQHRQLASPRLLEGLGEVAVRLFQVAALGCDLAEDAVAGDAGGPFLGAFSMLLLRREARSLLLADGRR